MRGATVVARVMTASNRVRETSPEAKIQQKRERAVPTPEATAIRLPVRVEPCPSAISQSTRLTKKQTVTRMVLMQTLWKGPGAMAPHFFMLNCLAMVPSWATRREPYCKRGMGILAFTVFAFRAFPNIIMENRCSKLEILPVANMCTQLHTIVLN